MSKLRILFLCTANSCRSQMAEGWARALHPDTVEAASAGTHPSAVNPMAVRVMREAGIDLVGHRSKHLDEFARQRFDYAVTLCDDAHQACPIFPGAAKTVHVPFPDPARATGSPEEVHRAFCRVRDQIRDFIAAIPDSLNRPEDGKDGFS